MKLAIVLSLLASTSFAQTFNKPCYRNEMGADHHFGNLNSSSAAPTEANLSEQIQNELKLASEARGTGATLTDASLLHLNKAVKLAIKSGKATSQTDALSHYLVGELQHAGFGGVPIDVLNQNLVQYQNDKQAKQDAIDFKNHKDAARGDQQ